MDFDSSSKFISSLAKFLQSLCNGYVEFNSGVEVIGHIYLNVDTGKKIDYILNEKVCKTDENSVTFISNSFHAQPAEKPKPSPKGSSDHIKQTENTDLKVDEEEIIIMDEPESKNVGTLPSRDLFRRKSISPHTKAGRPPKRPHSQNFSSVHKHSKQHKSDPSLPGPNGAQHEAESIHSESNSSSNFVPPQLTSETSLAAASESDISHLSKVFPQTFGDSSNNQSASEERDIKPQLDGDMNIIQVKQEFSHSEHGGEEDQETYDDSQDQSTVFPGMPYDPYYGDGNRRGHRSDYGPGGLSQDFFQGSAGPSEGVGDSSGGKAKAQTGYIKIKYNPHQAKWQPGQGCPIEGCVAKKIVSAARLKMHWREKHEKLVTIYACSICASSHKRRSDLNHHVNTKHKMALCDIEIILAEKINRQFMDPSPLTLAVVLGDI
ncbi:unnamed protein product [Lymnaea stagnalis]|uniref:C2H2-type domain-containing protein n=1 Tax=Lymnaea stagnalis TaxID=6523 RepID=A0AAV2H0Z4_LYMST